jgi:Uma2 family endonuclease
MHSPEVTAMSSTLDAPRTPLRRGTPLLTNGDHLDQATFHRLYEQTPEDFHAELIQGVVFVSCPVANPHCEYHAEVVIWLGTYKAYTPGTRVGDNGTVILDESNEPQPDVFLRIDESLGGNTSLNDKQYVVGPPELHVEIANTSAAIDLHDKKDAYEGAGVLEYLVLLIQDRQVRCFRLEGDSYRETFSGDSGIWKSEVFPGLWLDCGALLERNTRGLLDGLQQGLATPEHEEFRRRLSAVQ